MDSKTLALIATLVMAATMTMNTSNTSSWEAYKATHGKVYSASEESYRQAIFMIAEQEVASHNADSTQTYNKAINFFSDLTNDEFKSIYLGWNGKGVSTVEEAPVVGASVNWVTKGAVQAVKDQGQCGSCWAFSAVASSESAKFLEKGVLGDFSESQLVDCSGSFGNQGCNGGLMDNAFNYYKANAICTEASYPYKAQDGSCKASSCTDDSFRVTGYTDCSGVSALTSAIQGRPVSVAVDATNWSSYSGGIFSNCGTSLDHGVLLAGYSTSSWLIKNSWGASWGESGYIRLAPGNTCGIANGPPSYPSGN